VIPDLSLYLAAAAAGMPAMAEDGTVSMTIHQINGDGAGLVLHFIYLDQFLYHFATRALL
jgi:hypothetical protein